MLRIILSVCFCLLIPLAPAHAAKAKETKAAVAAAPAAPALPEAQVLLDGKPVLTIRIKVASFSPADRARTISDRLQKLVKDPQFRPELLAVSEAETSSEILAGDLVLMSINDGDAAVEGKKRSQLAQEHLGRIKQALVERQSIYSMNSILFGVGYSLLATLVLAFLVGVTNRLVPKLVEKLSGWKETRIRSIRFQNIEFLSADRIVAVLISLVRWLRIVWVVGLLYLYLPLVFSFFPWTQGLAAKLYAYIEAPVVKVGSAVVMYLPNIFFIAVIVICTHYVIKFTAFVFAEVEKGTIVIPGFYRDWANPSFKIARFLIIAFAAVVLFPYLPGSDSPAFKGVSVFLGVLFSLGSTSAIGNIVAGVILTYMRAFSLGDRVKIAETMGDVVEKTLLVTRIRTIKHEDITIPNAMVLGSHITNYSSSSQQYGLILHTTVTIGYDAPWRQVHQLLIDAATATENILTLPAPFVLQTSLDDFYVSYQINAYTDRPSIMACTYSLLHQHIQDKFNEGGIEIMSPHYATLRDGNQTTIPADYLPDDYRAPGFRTEPAGR
ncbi:mechanosensitive ion channel family protein [Trichlorobacter lovleyi]|uniref:mechanosensitive ion channel family protein n=1 Tax=Trichlorobacter lovleyi TaxID=313985 RepID=UPI002240C08E|nr:mechanosensitive ion channel family protein [Trichlorobacter lovleyi]QOX78853.1 mechanosensitive ion channel family protein [Trichlorobacter lovleyi]